MRWQIFFVLFAFLLVLILAFVVGCGSVSIAEIKENPEKYIGEEVTVTGVVENSVKIGSISGFSLREGNHSIIVQSKELPADGKKVTVHGTLMKEVFLGYYIYAKKIY